MTAKLLQAETLEKLEKQLNDLLSMKEPYQEKRYNELQLHDMVPPKEVRTIHNIQQYITQIVEPYQFNKAMTKQVITYYLLIIYS